MRYTTNIFTIKKYLASLMQGAHTKLLERLINGDRWLWGAIAAGMLLGLQGFNWGKFDCLNPDAMAFRSLFVEDRLPFEPEDFYKPPLYSYVGHFVGRLPAMVLSSPFLLESKERRAEIFFRIRLSLMRLVNLALFGGLVFITYTMIRHAYGVFPARGMAWLLATSAGFVPYQVYLTTDLAVTFGMVFSLYFAYAVARCPNNRTALIAGLAVGLTTATKYNGLAAAIALPLAHWLAPDPKGRAAFLTRRSTYLSALGVPLGFLLGNPYALIRFPRFLQDFHYNYETTPVYSGRTEGFGYGQFFELFGEIYGWPGSIFLLLLIVLGGLYFLRYPASSNKSLVCSDYSKLCILSMAIFMLYAWKIGAFPRMTTRFVLPVAPLILFLAAAGLAWLAQYRRSLLTLLGVLVFYNILCSIYLGSLFRKDPRMLMLSKITTESNAGDHKKIHAETSKMIPAVDLQTQKRVEVLKMPKGFKRAENFETIFAENEKMMAFKDRWETEVDINWFSARNRQQRNPDWVIWTSLDVDDLIRPYYQEMFNASSGYKMVFDAVSPPLPWWVYPRNPDFLINRTTFWKKSS